MSVSWQPVELRLDHADDPCVSVSKPIEEDSWVVLSHVQHIENYPIYYVPRLGAR